MGLFKKIKEFSGTPSSDLMQNGQLGRGDITAVQRTGVSKGPEFAAAPVCVFTVEVSLDNVAPYEATCRQAVTQEALAQLVPGTTTVAVRVNPNDPSEIALDLATDPPTVIAPPSGTSAAEILASGAPCRAVIVQSEDLGKKNQSGVAVYGFVLTVIVDGKAPYQIQVGNPVPPEAVPLLFNGSNVPAKVLSDNPNAVVIDWTAALAEYEKK